MKAVFTHFNPGRIELLSLKALKAIMKADIVISEDPLPPELAEYLPGNCELLSGFRETMKFLSRRRRQSLLLVRLFSADAVCTGPLLEETRLFAGAGFSTEIIPAVSAMQALAAERRFPLTRRGLNQSFWVIDGKLSRSFARLLHETKQAAASSASLVLLNTGRFRPKLLAAIGRERNCELNVCAAGPSENAFADLVIISGQGAGAVCMSEPQDLREPPGLY